MKIGFIGTGAWYTINWARQKARPFIVVWPDGTMMVEGLRDRQA